MPDLRIPRTAVTVALAVAALLLTLNRAFHERTVADPFFALTLAGVALVAIQVSVVRRVDTLRLFTLSAALTGLQVLLLHVPFKPTPAFAVTGMAAVLILILKRVWSPNGSSPGLNDSLLPPLLLVLMSYLGAGLLGMVTRAQPRTYDLALYGFDEALGGQISCRIGQVILASHWLRIGAAWFYYALPLAVMFVYAAQLVRNRSFALTAFLSLLVVGPVGIVFYTLVPGCGPICFLGPQFPFHPPPLAMLAQLPIQPGVAGGPRNAFPSLHLAWALLVWWCSLGLSARARAVLLAFLVGTAFIIPGIGEHYAVDLIGAIPFAVMIEAACALQIPIRDPRRFLPLATGLIFMAGWALFLRADSTAQGTTPAVAWIVTLASVTIPLLARRPLRRSVIQSLRLSEREPE